MLARKVACQNKPVMHCSLLGKILDRISGLWPDVKNTGGKPDLLFKAHVFLNFAWNGLRQSIAVIPAHTPCMGRVCERVLIRKSVQQVRSAATIMLSWL